MLTQTQRKLIRSLHSKKGRETSGLCLVEGDKVIKTAGNAVDYHFNRDDVEHESDFFKLVTTESPQEKAAVARIPQFSHKEIDAKETILILDGVQDPGNVGTILRLCLAFDASLVLIESADVTSPKVIRSSVGAMFLVPWAKISREKAEELLQMGGREIYRLENRKGAEGISTLKVKERIVLIAGSEGSGIVMNVKGKSVAILHKENLESLNVATAVGIALHERFIDEVGRNIE